MSASDRKQASFAMPAEAFLSLKNSGVPNVKLRCLINPPVSQKPLLEKQRSSPKTSCQSKHPLNSYIKKAHDASVDPKQRKATYDPRKCASAEGGGHKGKYVWTEAVHWGFTINWGVPSYPKP